MSEDNEADTSSCCASCGMAESDDIKLKKCTACKSVRYCSVKCQREHRPQHKRVCKKRAAELRDEMLFKQPESTYPGDCPICMIPLPLDITKSIMQSCCSKIVCRGCSHANMMRQMQESLDETCPFCRKPAPAEKDVEGYRMKRIEANDPNEMQQQGSEKYDEGDYSSAFEYFTKAARLGDVVAQYNLSVMYREGEGVEKDKKKEIYHLEQAAIGGHSRARNNLGCHEGNSGRMERAIKHFIIAANQGHDGAIEVLRGEHARGRISKENFAAALRAHQAAVDATKSPQREAAEEFYRNLAEDC
jgi:tetratricopeptide (TPR) repeat protein